MPIFLNPNFAYFLIVAMVWLYRARRALRSVDLIPAIQSAASAAQDTDPVTVVLPAKNEEKNICECVNRLLAQNYPHLQILIANDQSRDNTEAILREMNIPQMTPGEIDSARRPKAAYVNVPETPPGWTGKNFAIHYVSEFVRGRWILFTDADTRHEPDSVSSVLSHAKKYNLELITLIPRCLTGSILEDMIQPSAMTLLGLWFPPEKANEPENKTVFGNGQFLWISRSLYQKLGGHESVRGEFLEDYALMREAKKMKARVQTALGTALFGTRMYDSLDGMWRGWRRIYLHAFEQIPLPLLGKFLSVLFFSVMPFACFIPLTVMAIQRPEIYGMSWGMALVILVFILGTAWKAYALIRAKRLFAVFHPIAAFFIAMFLLDAWMMALTKQKTTWR